MLNKLTILLALFALPFTNYACEVFSIDLRVQPLSNPSSINHTFDVEIKVLLDDSCHFASQTHRFYVWTACGEKHSAIATISKSRAISSSEFGCINTAQLSDTTLHEYTLTGSFTLNDSKCASVFTYFEYGQQTFYNIEDYDSLAVPMAGWVLFNGTHYDTLGRPYTNTQYSPDTTLNLVASCLLKSKTISPMISDREGDSLFVEITKISWVDTTSVTFPTLQKRDYLGFYNKAYPFPSSPFSMHNKHRRITFSPTDTGLYALPILAIEYDYDLIFGLWYRKSTTYHLIPLFVSDQCSPSQTEAFANDTIQFNCGHSKLYLPLQAKADPASISADGSDLKFHNANGYPALVSSATAKNKGSSYTDVMEVDIQFLYDGYYQIQLLRGADGNRLIDDCGFEMNGNNRITVHVTGCPVAALDDFKSEKLFSVHPNPAHSHITIDAKESHIKDVVLYSLAGKKVFELHQKDSLQKITLPLNEEWKGLYYVQIQNTEGAIHTEKVIIK